MDEIREVLLRACTGMANGPDIMARYDAQSAKLATQAEELERARERVAECQMYHEPASVTANLRDQLTKQSAVVEAAKMWAGIWKNQGVSNYLTQAVQDLTTTDTGERE